MYSVSSHTIQINAWVALSKERQEFSGSLAEHDYLCDLIEEKMSVNGDEVHPDIVLTSPSENHSIVVDCKSKTLTADQLRRYQKIQQNSSALFESSKIKSKLSSNGYRAEVCYSSLTDLSMKRLLVESGTPFVHFKHEPTSGVSIWNPIQFSSSSIASTFPINLNEGRELPTEFYPFDIEQHDDNEQFVATIIQALLYVAMNKNTIDTESILQEAHPYWERVGNEKQTRFIHDTNKILRELENRDIQGFIEKVANQPNKWRVHHQTASAIQDRMEGPKFVEGIADVLEQHNLSDSAS